MFLCGGGGADVTKNGLSYIITNKLPIVLIEEWEHTI